MENLTTYVAYMIRNDGQIFDSGETHAYLSSPDDLDCAIEDIYTWANAPANQRALDFLLKNTQYQHVKEEINSILEEERSVETLYQYCKNIYHDLNQEFLRARYGGEYFYQESKEMYFRVSSQRFNWFDIIWQFVFKFQKQITHVTIEHDVNTFRDNRAYKLNGIELNHLDIDTFLTLPGNPIIEKLENEFEQNPFLKNLRKGKSIYESAETLPSPRARVLYESTFSKDLIDYDLNHCMQHVQ